MCFFAKVEWVESFVFCLWVEFCLFPFWFWFWFWFQAVADNDDGTTDRKNESKVEQPAHFEFCLESGLEKTTTQQLASDKND